VRDQVPSDRRQSAQVPQAGGDLGETAPAFVFVVVLAGLALVLVAGYRWLSRRPDA